MDLHFVKCRVGDNLHYICLNHITLLKIMDNGDGHVILSNGIDLFLDKEEADKLLVHMADE